MDLIFSEIELHAEIGKYLDNDDLNRYTEAFNLDVPIFWGYLLTHLYPEYNITYIEGYPFKNIFFTLEYIDEYAILAKEYLLYIDRIDEYKKALRTYEMRHIISDDTVVHDPKFQKMYPEYTEVLEEPVNLMHTLINYFYTGFEYLVLFVKFKFIDDEIETILVDFVTKITKKLLEFIIDGCTSEDKDHFLYGSFSSNIRNNNIEFAKLIHSKMSTFDKSEFYGEFEESILPEEMITIETFEYVCALLGDEYIDILYFFGLIPIENMKLLKHVEGKLPSEKPEGV